MLGRIANLFKGFLNVFIGSDERQNPEALLELEKENLRKQIANFTTTSMPQLGSALIGVFATGALAVLVWHLVAGRYRMLRAEGIAP